MQDSSPKTPSFQKQPLFLAAPLALALFAGLIYGSILAAVDTRSSLYLLEQYRPSVPTRLYDRNGEVFAELYRHRQELVPFQQIPAHVRQAFLAVEDTNFYKHWGLDFRGIARAFYKNILAGGVVQGGSTLTQQLAKQIYLNAEGRRFRSYLQKIRETILALQIEEAFSKEEILEVYFNVIYLGHGCKGIACAARLYFNKKAADLSIAEGALLARLPRAPVYYSPFKNPQQARKAHRYVLERMVAAGFLAPQQIANIYDNFWLQYWPRIITRSPSQTTWGNRLNEAPYFTEYVRQILEQLPQVGPEALYTQSLQIYTTLDRQHQRIAQREMKNVRSKIAYIARGHALGKGSTGVDYTLFDLVGMLRRVFPIHEPIINELSNREKVRRNVEEKLLDGLQLLSYLSPADRESAALDFFRQKVSSNFIQLQLQQAFVSIQSRTGYITAMIGGTEFSPRNQFNRVLQAYRQPGSAFKIFVYGAALEQRTISSQTTIHDAPFLRAASDGSSWTPENYDPGFRGLVSASRALASSLNTCAVQVYLRVGYDPIRDIAGRLMKMTNSAARLKEEPSLALGASEITPMELTTAMAVIANEGRDVTPFAIRYVSDFAGNIIYNQEDQIRKTLAIKTQEDRIQLIEPGLAYILRRMLQYVSDSGTARYGLRRPEHGDFTGEFASKTGTTSNYSDAWITGFNPEYSATVWFGFDKSSVTMGAGQSGGGIAAPVIGRIFRSIYKERNLPYPKFEKRDAGVNTLPQGVIYSKCKGLALAERVVAGEIQKLQEEEPCEGQPIYDERRLLMGEMGITEEDIDADTETPLEFR